MAYYPFTGEEKKAPGDGGLIKADTRAANQASDKQSRIDFLWDSKTSQDLKDFSASNPDVNFKFSHMMSKISFTFQSSEPIYDKINKELMLSDGVNVATMVSYEIEGLGLKGTFNTADGSCVADTKRENLTITFAKENGEMKERPFPPLIVFPQAKPNEENGA